MNSSYASNLGKAVARDIGLNKYSALVYIVALECLGLKQPKQSKALGNKYNKYNENIWNIIARETTSMVLLAVSLFVYRLLLLYNRIVALQDLMLSGSP